MSKPDPVKSRAGRKGRKNSPWGNFTINTPRGKESARQIREERDREGK